jgi:hypothetical protein
MTWTDLLTDHSELSHLEELALDAHAAGTSWKCWIDANIGTLLAILDKPDCWTYCTARDHLRHCLLTGEPSGELPPPVADCRDAPLGVVADVGTAARFHDWSRSCTI